MRQPAHHTEEDSRGAAVLSPEQQLVWAVLREAIETACEPVPENGNHWRAHKQRREQAEALAWIEWDGRGTAYPHRFTFADCCTHLRIPPHKLRLAVSDGTALEKMHALEKHFFPTRDGMEYN